jgi:hypothetical protein
MFAVVCCSKLHQRGKGNILDGLEKFRRWKMESGENSVDDAGE